MKKFFALFFLLILCSCGQDYNSNYNDRGTYADIGIPPGTPLYDSYLIFRNKCFACHQWKDYTTSQAWVGGTMPPDPYSQLTTAELETVRNWINSL
jgi:hypothetical protein